MVTFYKNYEHLLPYNRSEYLSFLDDDIDSESNWHGVSIQKANHASEIFNNLLNVLHQTLDLFSDQRWIVCHDDKDLPWLPSVKGINDLPLLHSLFKRNNISDSFSGAIVFEKGDLVNYCSELLLYPSLLSYKNLDMSFEKFPLILKMTSHLTLDILSKDMNNISYILSKLQLKELNSIFYAN